MARSDRRYLFAMLASGAVAIGAVALLWVTAAWFTPGAEAAGLAAGLVFAALGLRWSFNRLGDVYG